jgi:hypothetical protein
MTAEKKKETDIKASLEEFAALVSSSLKRISFENKQKLLRMVLDKIVVNDWKVDVHYNIPLPKPTPPPERKVSTQFDLRSACRDRERAACGVHGYGRRRTRRSSPLSSAPPEPPQPSRQSHYES